MTDKYEGAFNWFCYHFDIFNLDTIAIIKLDQIW